MATNGGASNKETIFIFEGPRNKKYSFLIAVIFIVSSLTILSIVWMSSLFWKVTTFGTLSIIGFSLWILEFIISSKAGFFDSNAHIFKIMDDRIESKQMDKHHVIYADNIKKIKYERDVGGTGSRVLIWPKDYDRLIEDGIDAKPEVIERMKKSKTALVLYPPALNRAERKRLKEAIEEFKKRYRIA